MLEELYLLNHKLQFFYFVFFFFFQAEDGIRDFCLSRGLGDVYKRQMFGDVFGDIFGGGGGRRRSGPARGADLRYDLELDLEDAVKGKTIKIDVPRSVHCNTCLLYTSDAATKRIV